MLPLFNILLPVFGLIGAGYAVRRRGMFGASAASELNRFVVWLALPAMLFQAMSHSTWAQLYQPGFVAAFGLAVGLTFALTLVLRRGQGRHLADAGIDALAAAYPNVGYMGFPLAMLALGPDSITPTTIATLLVACVLFSVAITTIEVALQNERAPHRVLIKVVSALLKNPLIIAPLAGAAVAASGLSMPVGIESFFSLLGGAAGPCALVSLGVFLADKPRGDSAPSGTLWITAAKLILQPALAGGLAYAVFDLSMPLVHTAMLLAALPTGTGPFMLAEFYGRKADITSRTILLSTLGSIVTLSMLLLWMQRGQ